MKIPSFIRDELDACGLPWRIERGKRHQKIVVADKFVGILPLNAVSDIPGTRSSLNIRAQIRRAIKELACTTR